MNSKTIIPIGIDWANAKHDFHLITPDGNPLTGTFKQDPTEIEKTIKHWRKLIPGATFVIAIEATKGALVNALIEYNDLQIFPINPAALASYRKASVHVMVLLYGIGGESASGLAPCTTARIQVTESLTRYIIRYEYSSTSRTSSRWYSGTTCPEYGNAAI